MSRSSPHDPLSVPERGYVVSSPSPEGRGGQGVRTQEPRALGGLAGSPEHDPQHTDDGGEQDRPGHIAPLLPGRRLGGSRGRRGLVGEIGDALRSRRRGRRLTTTRIAVHKTNSRTAKWRKLTLANQNQTVPPARWAFSSSSTSRAAPSTRPVTSAANAPLPFSLGWSTPNRKHAAIGGAMYAWTLWGSV